MSLNICLNCHQFITFNGTFWLHDATGAAQCRMAQPPVATPAPRAFS